MKSIDSRRQFLFSSALFAATGASSVLAPSSSAGAIDIISAKPRLRKTRTAAELGKGCVFSQYKLTGGSPSLINGTVYISDGDSNKPRPLVVYVNGTGQPCSNFAIRNGVVGPSGATLHHMFQELVGDRARIMVVDNAGVEFGDQFWNFRRGMLDTAPSFLENHTFPKWIELLKSAVEAAWQEPFVDSSRTLLCGHSDGASVVSRLAELMPNVSHVAPLSAGGLCHLLFFGLSKPETFSASLEQSLKELQDMALEPNSIEKFYAGFTYRFWTSGYLFLSDFESLARASARIYTAHGTADRNNSVEGFDFMCVGLKMLGKDIVVERVEGADHSFSLPETKPPEGFRPIFANILKWFL
jgi:pimeloyl-ACP methyl ester carboxylesterase